MKGKNYEGDKQPMGREEFEPYNRSRIQKNHFAEPLQVQRRILIDDIKIGDPQIHYGKTIQELRFENCYFDGEVKVKGDSAGTVTFKDCIFNKPVEIDYTQVSFEDICIFNSELNVFINNNSPGEDISNIVVKAN